MARLLFACCAYPIKRTPFRRMHLVAATRARNHRGNVDPLAGFELYRRGPVRGFIEHHQRLEPAVRGALVGNDHLRRGSTGGTRDGTVGAAVRENVALRTTPVESEILKATLHRHYLTVAVPHPIARPDTGPRHNSCQQAGNGTLVPPTWKDDAHHNNRPAYERPKVIRLRTELGRGNGTGPPESLRHL